MAEVVSGLQLGVEYNPEADALSPLLTWRALSEGPRRPALILGTSSDRIGTPSGQSYYATVAKGFRAGGVGVAPYVGLAYGEFDDTMRAIGGVNLSFSDHWSSLLIHDGVNVHPTLTWSAGMHDVTLLWVDLDHLGVAWSIRF